MSSRGYEQHRHRASELSRFGKDLVRRSGAHCELCAAGEVSLSIYEVPPIPSEPDLEHCIFICDVCHQQILRPKSIDPDHWHCLVKTAWSPVPSIQVISVRILNKLSSSTVWSRELLEQLYVEPEILDWIEKHPEL